MDNVIKRILQEYIQQRDSVISEIDFTKHAVDRYFKRFMDNDHLVVKYAKNELSPEKNFYFKTIGSYKISDDIKEDMYELYSRLQDVDYLKRIFWSWQKKQENHEWNLLIWNQTL